MADDLYRYVFRLSVVEKLKTSFRSTVLLCLLFCQIDFKTFFFMTVTWCSMFCPETLRFVEPTVLAPKHDGMKTAVDSDLYLDSGKLNSVSSLE